jgi:hypothetical protein
MAFHIWAIFLCHQSMQATEIEIPKESGQSKGNIIQNLFYKNLQMHSMGAYAG